MKALYFLLWLFSILLLFSSCQKENKNLIPPNIEFVKDSGFVFSDTLITPGSSIKIGVKGSMKEKNITYFSIRVDNGILETYLDSGMNTTGFTYIKNIIKSNAPFEKWTFLVMDKNRVMKSISIKFTKKDISNYGEINFIPSIMLGAQNNSSNVNFYSISQNKIFNQDSAFNHQALIDLIYYYGTYNSTISSPGEADVPNFYTGPTGISNWTIKNTTYYDTTIVTTQQFDAANNDSLLLVQFDQVNGKKKAKFLQTGMVVSFIDQAGKIGLFKVINVVGTDAGTVEISIKIQK